MERHKYKKTLYIGLEKESAKPFWWVLNTLNTCGNNCVCVCVCVFVVFTSLCWRGKLVKWVRKVRERQIKEEGVTNQVGSASWLAVRVLTGSSSRDALRDQHHCRWGWEPSGYSGRFPPPEGAISLLLLEAGPLHPEHRWTASVWRKEHLYHLWQYIQTKNFNYVLRTKAISIFFP